MGEYNTKGSHVLLARQWFDQALGEGSLDTLAGVPYPRVVLPGGWYEAGPLVKALAAASTQVNRPVQDIAADIAKQNALQDLTTIYRVFLRVASPVRFLAFTPQLWRNYVAFASATTRINALGRYVGVAAELPTPYVEWAEGAWRGFLPTAIELAGGKRPVAKITGKRQVKQDEWTFDCEIDYGT